MSSKPRIKAVIYDLDGVLVEARDWHFDALNKALMETSGFSIDREDHLTILNGKPTRVKLEMLRKNGLIKKEDIPYIENLKQAYTKEYINLFARPDRQKLYLHRILVRRGIFLGCCTNSIRETAHHMLSKTEQIGFMSTLITNQDVSKTKPDPEGYQMAMRVLQVKPSQTLIIEDSQIGVQAAMATGARVMIVKGPEEVNWGNIKKFIGVP
jgi:beta-phosphoglucomutase